MSEESKSASSLSELRKEEDVSSKWKNLLPLFKEKCPYFFDLNSLFYYFLLMLLLGFFWTFYSLVTNSFTGLLGWDYTWQYVPMGYYTHDVWWGFLTTGHFDLYSANTFLGTDNIGSNAYYGLFDPFNIFVILAPRSWVPQMMAIAAFFKGAVGAMLMRAFLKYRGCKEWTARLGGAAFAFNGFFTFMSGFPTVISAAVYIPMMLWGIEKVIKENKPTVLAFSLWLTGTTNFFYLVVYCVFGVIYAMWRYFSTFKSRSGKSNISVIGLGVFGFAVGILMCSYVLLPSIRASSLSGRTMSIGQAYIRTIWDSLKTWDWGTAFGLIFGMVGENPGRELMGLISFFYPTTGYTYLPLSVPASGTGTGYDAWTASLFCYTPMVIFFIYGILGACRRKEWGTICGFGLSVIAVFTTFSYYFFYLFTGDGYGRWFIVLVPLIIYVACHEFDRIKENPQWQLPTASAIAVVMTVLTLVICTVSLDGKKFESPNNLTYWFSSYVPIGGSSTIYIVIYQIILVVVECLVIYFLRNKEALPKVLLGFVMLEAAVAGNLNFFYGSSWSYQNHFEGGSWNRTSMQRAADYINDYDDSYYRVYTDFYNCKNDGLTYNVNMDSHFHSLFNFDLDQFVRMMGNARNDGSETTTYGGYTYSSKVWSASYNNKRYGYDTLTGHKYYIIANEGYSTWNDEALSPKNVPFDSTLVYRDDDFAIYQSGTYLDLGFGVDTLYQHHYDEESQTANKSAFYSGSPSQSTLLRNEGLLMDSAIVEDNDVERLPESLSVLNPNEEDPIPTSYTQYGYKSLATVCDYYVTTSEDDPSSGEVNFGGFHPEDPGGFLNPETQDQYLDHSVSTNPKRVTAGNYVSMEEDHGKLVFSPYNGQTYFNESDGAYIEMYYGRYSNGANRVYLIGDYTDEEGVLHEYALLSYEYRSISTFINNDDQGTPMFGLYANGKIRHIVVCAKSGWGDATTNIGPSHFSFYMKEKSAIDEEIEKYRSSEYALQDVTRVNNDTFSFKTEFTNEKMVVTQLGYDDGWGIKAYDKDGNVLDGVETYKLDGGLLGFNALSGETYYTLEYVTPYLNFSVALASIGTALLLGFIGLSGYLEYRKIKSQAQDLAK